MAPLLERTARDLPMLFIVSDVELHVGAADGADAVQVDVEKAPRREVRTVLAVSCPRSGTEPEWAGICDRCVDALARAGAPVTS